MTKTAIPTFIILLLLACPTDLGAQESSVAPGARVRLSVASSPGQLIGEVLALEADTLRLSIEGTNRSLLIRIAEIESLEISRRAQRSWVPVAAVGLLVGAGAGALIGQEVTTDGEAVAEVFYGAIAGGVAGTVAGVSIGKKMGAERWEGMSLPGVGMVLSPVRQAPLSFSFTLTLR